LPIFDPKKCYNPLSSPVLSTSISATLPSVSQDENIKGLRFVDVAEVQEAVTEEFKKVQKGIFGSFQKLYNRAKACIYSNKVYFELKKKQLRDFLMCLQFLKKISPKLLDRTVYIHG
jgi:hypothetical protein